MLEPRYKSVNTIAVRFYDGERNREIVKVLLRDIFKLKPSDIGGVGNDGRNSIHVKFTSANVSIIFAPSTMGKSFQSMTTRQRSSLKTFPRILQK